MAKDPIKKAKNGTYYFRANLGYDSKGKRFKNIVVDLLLKKKHEKNTRSCYL